MSASQLGFFNLLILTDAGLPALGGRIYTYVAGTTTQKTAYTDAAASVPHTYTSDGIGGQYIALNARGELPAPLHGTAGRYDICLKTSAGATVWTRPADPTADAATAIDAAIRGDLASTTDASKGASLIGYRGPSSPVAGTVAQRLAWEIYVTDPQFGAVNDGVTVSTTAIQAAATYAGTLVSGTGFSTQRTPVLIFPSGPGFVASAMIDVPGGVSVRMESPLFIKAAANVAITGLRIGYTTVVNQNWRGLCHVLDVRRQTDSDWSQTTDCLIDIQSCFGSTVYLKRTGGAYTGVNFTGSYNRIYGGDFVSCRQGFRLVDNAYNFSNQNTMIGGEFTNRTNTSKTRYGIVNEYAGYSAGNSNRFIGQSFEMDHASLTGGAESIPILVNGCSDTKFDSVRVEDCGTTYLRLTGDSRWVTVNSVINGEVYFPDRAALDDQSTYKIGNTISAHGDWSPGDGILIFDSGLLSKNYVAYGADKCFIGTEAVLNTSPATFQPNTSGTTINADGSVTIVGASGAIPGVRLRANNCKKFAVVVSQTSASTLAELDIVVFNSAGTQLTGGADVLTNTATPTNTPNGGVFGGLYSLPIIGYPRVSHVVTFSSNVDTAFIGLAATSLFSFQIYALDGIAETFTGYSLTQSALVLSGSATYDPPSLADGVGVTTTVTVTGAALGDYVRASFSIDLQEITLTAWVSAANTVSVRFQNESGGALDLASGTLKCSATKG